MRPKTLTSLQAFQAEAKKIRETKADTPDSVTTSEFCDMSGVGRMKAGDILNGFVKRGRAERCMKRVNGRLIPAFKMKSA